MKTFLFAMLMVMSSVASADLKSDITEYKSATLIRYLLARVSYEKDLINNSYYEMYKSEDMLYLTVFGASDEIKLKTLKQYNHPETELPELYNKLQEQIDEILSTIGEKLPDCNHGSICKKTKGDIKNGLIETLEKAEDDIEELRLSIKIQIKNTNKK